MNYLKSLLISICGNLLLLSNAFSYGETIYCPSIILCVDTNQENCRISYYSPGYAKYFGNLSYVGSGLYSFQGATATFNSPGESYRCYYKHSNGTVYLPIKPESNIEVNPLSSIPSAWVFKNMDGNCNKVSVGSSYSCPFTERFGFLIHNMNLSGGVFAAINGVRISNLIAPTAYVGIIYDDALVGCGGKQECTIDILSAKGANYGSIKVDMDTMKIIEVTPLYSTKIQINKIEPFNSIRIGYPNLTQ